MRLFNTICIEIGARCNRKCWFCPNAINKRPNSYLPAPIITSIITQLSKMNYDKRITLYVYNEPLLDERLCNIAKRIRQRVPKATIMIATNTDYIKGLQDIVKLYNSGINQIQFNIYSNEERYKTIHNYLSTLSIPMGNVYSNGSPKQRIASVERKFTKSLTPDANKIGKFQLTSRAGNIPTVKDQDKIITVQGKTCVRPFRMLNINYKGEAILCCNDYHADVVIGNVAETSLHDIWFHSPVMNTYRKALLRKDGSNIRSKLKLCSTCSFAGGAYTHLIFKQWNADELTT